MTLQSALRFVEEAPSPVLGHVTTQHQKMGEIHVRAMIRSITKHATARNVLVMKHFFLDNW